ncbi:hypothetical protein NL108_006982 [Boleophthalmus pectinirostris]|nr:hypothetical protein NL108_006982 [Boleophthalmus pectinirostris]
MFAPSQSRMCFSLLQWSEMVDLSCSVLLCVLLLVCTPSLFPSRILFCAPLFVCWDGANIIGTEENKHRRWIKKAVEIQKRAHRTINGDEGLFYSHTPGILS